MIDQRPTPTRREAAPRASGPPEEGGDGGPPLAVGLFCPSWPPEQAANGIVSYVDAVAEGMARLGHRPFILAGVVTGPIAGDAAAPVVDLGPLLGPSPAGRLAGALASRLRLGAADPTAWPARGLARASRGGGGAPRLDVLELEESFGLPGAVASRSRVPVVARLHGPWFLNGPNQGADPGSPAFARRVRAEGRALRAAAGVTAPSADVLRRTREHYGLPLPGAEAIDNPVRPVPPDRRWRAEDREPEHVLFVGRFDRHKGGDTAIDAFALLLRERPGARLTFVGPDRGLDRDGRPWSLPEYVGHRLPGALEDGRVRWLGQRPPAEIAALRLRAAATMVASRYETFAITVTEALAAGCPLVATRAGGAAGLFEHGRHGLYVDPEDPGALAAALLALLADPAGASAMGRAASEYCGRRYALEAVAARTIRFYRRVLAGVAAPGGGRP